MRVPWTLTLLIGVKTPKSNLVLVHSGASQVRALLCAYLSTFWSPKFPQKKKWLRKCVYRILGLLYPTFPRSSTFLGKDLKNHTARFVIATTYSISAIKYLAKQRNEGRVYFGSEFGSTPHHGGRNKVMLEAWVVAKGTWGRKSHCKAFRKY